MDFENNGQDATRFMHKIKKQAKRLFQLSKTNSNNLQINSLSKAQEILAQINGYPDWHALEKNITGSKSILTKEKTSRIELERYSYDNLYYLEVEDSITTFLRINTLPSNVYKIQEIINYFNDMFSFQINMGLHDISIIFEQKNKPYEKEVNYSLYSVSKSFNLSEEEAQKLFYIDKSKTKQLQENSLTLYVIVSTKVKNKHDHLNLCLSILGQNHDKMNLESIPYLDKEQLDSFQMKNATSNAALENSLLEHGFKSNEEGNIFLMTKWVYLLNFLNEKKLGFLLKYSITDETIVYEFDNYLANKEILDSFINSAIKTTKFNQQELKYFSKPNYNYVQNNDTSGLTLKSVLNNGLFYYNDSSSMRTSHVDLIYGRPGTGKSVLNNMITLSSLLNKDLSSIPHVAIIDVGPSYQGMINLFKNILPVEMKHIVKQYNIENKKEYAINIFDLPLGKRQYDYEDAEKISIILSSLLKYNEMTCGLLKEGILSLNSISDKYYIQGENSLIDKMLLKLEFKITEKTTWWNVVDFLFTQQHDDLAFKAQKYATPTLSDFIGILSSEKTKDIFGKILVDTGENLIQNTIRVLTEYLIKYPFINSPTKLEINDTKIAYFNLDKVSSFKEKEIQSYWFSSVLHLITYYLIGMGNYIYSSHSYDWKGDWKEYTKENPIELVYDYYNRKKLGNNWRYNNKLVIDEFHRFSHNESSMHQLRIAVRESRKHNVAVSLSSQSLDDFYSIKDFATAFFISETNTKELTKLSEFGFEANEIEIMQKMKSLNWAVKLTTNRGKVFDIVQLEMNDYLMFSLSTLSEDVILKNELLKKYDYMTMLDKGVKYLKENKLKSFKYLFEVEKEKNRTNEEIIKDLLNSIK